LQAQKAHATIRCAEQLANFKCRRSIEMARTGEAVKARKLTDEAVDLLGSLNRRFGESVERLALLGGAYKRRAEIDVGNRGSLQKNLVAMHTHYLHAYEKNLELNGTVYSYPLLNALAAKWLLHKTSPNGYDLKEFAVHLESARQANMVTEINQEYFWQAIATTDISLLEALKMGALTSEKADFIAKAYEQMGRVASSPRQMRSVMEYVDFLYTVTRQWKLPEAEHLNRLRNRLRRFAGARVSA
jgi:hypothetical protein